MYEKCEEEGDKFTELKGKLEIAIERKGGESFEGGPGQVTRRRHRQGRNMRTSDVTIN